MSDSGRLSCLLVEWIKLIGTWAAGNTDAVEWAVFVVESEGAMVCPVGTGMMRTSAVVRAVTSRSVAAVFAGRARAVAREAACSRL